MTPYWNPKLEEDIDILAKEGKLKKVMDDSGNWTGLVRITEKGIDYVENTFPDNPEVQRVKKKRVKNDL